MEGDPLTLACTCEGQCGIDGLGRSLLLARLLGTSDDLEFTWLRNSKEIPENPDFRREREGNTFRLVVTEV